jgi:hypothetical protein
MSTTKKGKRLSKTVREDNVTDDTVSDLLLKMNEPVDEPVKMVQPVFKTLDPPLTNDHPDIIVKPSLLDEKMVKVPLQPTIIIKREMPMEPAFANNIACKHCHH